MSISYDYPRANITTDIVYVHPHKGVLLIKRKNYPDAGKWATPGGHLEINERLADCAKREFWEEVGFTPKAPFQLVGVFDKIGRDPRDRYLTFVYLVKWTFGDEEPQAGDDAVDCTFVDVEEVRSMDLAIDHKEVLMNTLFGMYKDSNAMECQ